MDKKSCSTLEMKDLTSHPEQVNKRQKLKIMTLFSSDFQSGGTLHSYYCNQRYGLLSSTDASIWKVTKTKSNA